MANSMDVSSGTSWRRRTWRPPRPSIPGVVGWGGGGVGSLGTVFGGGSTCCGSARRYWRAWRKMVRCRF